MSEQAELLNVLRNQGYTEVDVQLTESGHDFVVGLDAMQRLLAAIKLADTAFNFADSDE